MLTLRVKLVQTDALVNGYGVVELCINFAIATLFEIEVEVKVAVCVIE